MRKDICSVAHRRTMAAKQGGPGPPLRASTLFGPQSDGSVVAESGSGGVSERVVGGPGAGLSLGFFFWRPSALAVLRPADCYAKGSTRLLASLRKFNPGTPNHIASPIV